MQVQEAGGSSAAAAAASSQPSKDEAATERVALLAKVRQLERDTSASASVESSLRERVAVLTGELGQRRKADVSSMATIEEGEARNASLSAELSRLTVEVQSFRAESDARREALAETCTRSAATSPLPQPASGTSGGASGSKTQSRTPFCEDQATSPTGSDAFAGGDSGVSVEQLRALEVELQVALSKSDSLAGTCLCLPPHCPQLFRLHFYKLTPHSTRLLSCS